MGIIMRNGVAYGGGTGDTNEFVGTTAEWNALDASEKARYKVVNFTDDYSFSPLLIVYTTTGSTVTVAKSGYVVVAKEVESGKFAAEIPEWGTYTITVSLNGATNTETFNVDVATIYEVEIDEPTPAPTPPTPSKVTVTIYSATGDTLSYTDVDGDSQTIVFSSGQSSKSVDIDLAEEGTTSLTFTSSIAKNPSNLSNDYSKTVAVTSETTELYIMPDNAIYWYGYMSDDFEIGSTANGWVFPITSHSFADPDLNTNYIDLNPELREACLIGSKTSHSLQTVHCIAQGIHPMTPYVSDPQYAILQASSQKDMYGNGITGVVKSTANLEYLSTSAENPTQAYVLFFCYGLTNYPSSGTGYNEESYLYALWYE